MARSFVLVLIFSLQFIAAGARAEEPVAPAPNKPAKLAKARKRTTRTAKKTGKSKGKKVVPDRQNDTEIGKAWLAAHPQYAPQAAKPAQLPPTTLTLPAPAPAPVVTIVPASMPQAQAAPAAPPLATRSNQLGSGARESGAASIYRLNPALDGIVIATAVLGSVVPFIFQDKIIRPRGLGNPADLNSLDQQVVGNSSASMATASNVTTLLALAAPVAIDLVDVGWSRELFEDGVVMSEVLAMSGLGVSYAKYSTQRRSPQLYLAGNTGAASNTSLYRSFVSWQTATTFASLSALSFTLTQRHELGGLSWIATGLIGGSVAAERIASGGAFYTDVIAGALVGVAAGTIVPWLHLSSRYNWTVAPAPNGVQVGGSGRF